MPRGYPYDRCNHFGDEHGNELSDERRNQRLDPDGQPRPSNVGHIRADRDRDGHNPIQISELAPNAAMAGQHNATSRLRDAHREHYGRRKLRFRLVARF